MPVVKEKLWKNAKCPILGDSPLYHHSNAFWTTLRYFNNHLYVGLFDPPHRVPWLEFLLATSLSTTSLSWFSTSITITGIDTSDATTITTTTSTSSTSPTYTATVSEERPWTLALCFTRRVPNQSVCTLYHLGHRFSILPHYIAKEKTPSIAIWTEGEFGRLSSLERSTVTSFRRWQGSIIYAMYSRDPGDSMTP